MKTCPACRKQIDVRATKCPYCHTSFGSAQMEAGRQERSKTWKRKLLILVVSGLVAIYALLSWLYKPGSIEWLATL